MTTPVRNTPTDSEFIAQLAMPHYNPRWRPLAIPEAQWNEGPCWCLSVNDEWASHILGLLEMLDQPDTWKGTDEEIDAARNQVKALITCFMESSMSCCCGQSDIPIQRRVTSDGQLQISRDGGVTWIQDPQDPRLTGTALPPPVTSGVSSTKCDAATNAVEHLKDVQAGVSNHLSQGLTAIELAAIVIGLLVALFFSGGFLVVVLIPLIIQIMAAIANLAPEEYDAIFTNDVWDKTLCALYCHIGEDGSFDQAGFDAAVSDLQTKLPGGDSPVGAAANMASFVKVWGLIGLNNACATGNAADADCSSCDCGCDLSGWGIAVNGVIDSNDGTEIVAHATLSGASYYIDLTGHPTGWDAGTNYSAPYCCTIYDQVFDNSSSVSSNSVPCGMNYGNLGVHDQGVNINLIEFISSAPFSVRIKGTPYA